MLEILLGAELFFPLTVTVPPGPPRRRCPALTAELRARPLPGRAPALPTSTPAPGLPLPPSRNQIPVPPVPPVHQPSVSAFSSSYLY